MSAPTLTTLDSLVQECGHHTMARTNNGYGCMHPKVDARDDITGEGQCFGFACPMATKLSPESEPLDAEWLREMGYDPTRMTDEGGWLVRLEVPRVVRLTVLGQVTP